MFVSVSVSGSFYGGSIVPSFVSHNGISSANHISSREIDPLSHMKDPIPHFGLRSHFFTGHQSSAVGVDHRVFLGRGYSLSSDSGVYCLPGIMLPKSGVPDPIIRSLRTPATVTMGLNGSPLDYTDPCEEVLGLLGSHGFEGGFHRHSFRVATVPGSEIPKEGSYWASVADAGSLLPAGHREAVIDRASKAISDVSSNVYGGSSSDRQELLQPSFVSHRSNIKGRPKTLFPLDLRSVGYGVKQSSIDVTGRPKKGSTSDLNVVASSDDVDIAGSMKGGSVCARSGVAGKNEETRSDRRSSFPVGSAPTRSKSVRLIVGDTTPSKQLSPILESPVSPLTSTPSLMQLAPMLGFVKKDAAFAWVQGLFGWCGFDVYRSGFGFFTTWLIKFSGLRVSTVGSVHVQFGSIWVTLVLTIFGTGKFVGSGR